MTRTEKQQTGINFLINVAFFVFNGAIGLYLVPFYLSTFGKAAYGFIPLTTVFTQYISLFSLPFQLAIARFLVIEIRRDNICIANKIFNTAFFTLVILALLFFIAVIPVCKHIDHFLDIPDDLLADCRMFFLISFGVFLFNICVSPLESSFIVYNRLDLKKYIEVGKKIINLILIISFIKMYPSLVCIAYANLISSLAAFVVKVFLFRRLMPKIVLSICYFCFGTLKPLVGMGGWLFVNKVGNLLFLRLDILLVNLFLGPVFAGVFAAINTIPEVIRVFGGTFSSILMPVLLGAYAQQNFEKIRRMLVLALKICGILYAIPIGIVCGFAGPLLLIWLGADFRKYSLILILMTIHLSVNLAVQPLFGLNNAMNRVKVPGLACLLFGVMKVVLVVVTLMFTDAGLLGIVFLGALSLTLKNLFFLPWYASVITKEKWYTYYLPIINCVCITLLVFVVGWLITHVINIDCFVKLISCSILIGFSAFCISWYIFLSHIEREQLISALPVPVGCKNRLYYFVKRR